MAALPQGFDLLRFALPMLQPQNMGANVPSAFGQGFPTPPRDYGPAAYSSAPAQSQMPAHPKQGQLARGADGKTYQYVQVDGGVGGSGNWGWSETNAPPLGRLGQFAKNNSDALLAAGLGGLGGGGTGPQLAAMTQGFFGTRKAEQKNNMTAEWLRKNDPELADLFEAGAISSDQLGSAILARRTAERKSSRPMTADEKKIYGIPDNDPRIFVMSDGKPSVLGGSSTNIQVGSKLTEGQSKDLSLLPRMVDAEYRLRPVEQSLTDMPADMLDRYGGRYSAMMQEPEFKQAKAAGSEVLALILRKDTGAAVTDTEWDTYGPIYLPAPGDDAVELANKRQARMNAINGLKIGLGTAREMGESAMGEVEAMYGKPLDEWYPINATSPSGREAELIQQLRALGLTDEQIEAAVNGGN